MSPNTWFRSPWPHHGGDMGRSNRSWAAGPRRLGSIQRVATPVPPIFMLVTTSGIMAAGHTYESYRYSGARFCVGPDGLCTTLTQFGRVEEVNINRLTMAAVGPDGSEWVHHYKRGFSRRAELARRSDAWRVPVITADNRGAVVIGQHLLVGPLGEGKQRKLRLPPTKVIPPSADIEDLRFEAASLPAVAPDGTIYVQSIWHLGRDSFDHTDDYLWRLFALRPGARQLEEVTRDHLEDAPCTDGIAISPGGHVVQSMWRDLEVVGTRVRLERGYSGVVALTPECLYCAAQGSSSSYSTKPKLTCVDFGSGEVCWSHKLERERGPKLIADGEGSLYHSQPGRVVARSTEGKILFEHAIEEITGLAISHGRTLLVGGVDGDGPCIHLIAEM